MTKEEIARVFEIYRQAKADMKYALLRISDRRCVIIKASSGASFRGGEPTVENAWFSFQIITGKLSSMEAYDALEAINHHKIHEQDLPKYIAPKYV